MFFKKTPKTVDDIIKPLLKVESELVAYRDQQQRLIDQYEDLAFEYEQKASDAHSEFYRADEAIKKIRNVFND